MLTKRIIPCLDVRDGRVVKGVNFEGLADVSSPVALGKYYSDNGADELVFYDITASAEGRKLFSDALRAVAEQIFIPLTVGGGVRKVEDIRRLLNAGADKISMNSSAVANPQLVKDAADKYGSQCIVVAIDAKRKISKADSPDDPPQWEVYTHGGRNNTGIDAVQWVAQMGALGAGEILLTSMDRDGMQNGFDLALTRAVSDAVSIPVIASGGVGNLQHLVDGIKLGHADAVLAASIFHFGTYTVQQAKAFMAAQGICVR